MQFEPQTEPEREEEALLIAVDASVPQAVFEILRDAAFRLARTRVLYPIGKNDLVGVIQAGSATTQNLLADANPGGYQGIQIHAQLLTASLRALRAIKYMNHDKKETNLLDLLDVAGDRLVTAAALRARTKRLLLFTDASSVICDLQDEMTDELIGVCKLYCESSIRVDVVLHGSPSDISEQAAEYFDTFPKNETSMESDAHHLDCEEHVEKAKGFRYAPLLAITKITGGVFMSLEGALPFLENPKPKLKRASAKFYGVLDIAGDLQIPVKRYTHVLEVKPAPGKKLSWSETCKRGRAILAIAETNRVASAKDDTVLQPEEIVNAYPYGPDLVPESVNVDGYAWGMHLDRGLHVLGFTAQRSVPQNLFLSSVDVVIPISDSTEAAKLMRTLVVSMHCENVGLLARSVIPKSGGAPSLCYLWPRIELCRKTQAIRNCYLFAVDVPMREDVRHMGFASLKDALNDMSNSAFDIMDNLISCSLLRPNGGVSDSEIADYGDDDTDEESDGTKLLIPSTIQNPNLDYMQICVAHRILEGTDSAELPPLSNWHGKLMSPESFLRKEDIESRHRTVDELKTTFPVLAVKQREKRNRRVHTAVNSDTALINHYLPADTMVPGDDLEVEDGGEDVDDLVGDEDMEDGQISVANGFTSIDNTFDAKGTFSEVTELNIVDVGEETPVEDFFSLVRSGNIGFGAQSIQVVIRRMIREGRNECLVVTCLQALRRACVEHREARLFNDFIKSLVERCKETNLVGKRTLSMWKSIGRMQAFKTAVELIRPPRPADAQQGSVEWKRYHNYMEYLQRCDKEAEELVKVEVTDPSMSTVQD